MPGQPYAKRNAGKGRGQKQQEERDRVLASLLPETGGEGDENPYIKLRRLREAAYDEIGKVAKQEAEDLRTGRTVITDEMCWEVIAMLEAGTTIIDSCRQLGYSFTGVFQRLMRTEKLKQAVDHAREMYAHGSVERMRRIILTEDDPARARVLTDLLKWETSKVLPKFYGDKIDVTTGDKVSFSINLAPSPGKDADKA